MSLYYCEFCNENKQIPIAKSKQICDTCGHFLRKGTISHAEIEQRKLDRTIHCPNCDKMVYSIPLYVLCNDFRKKHEFKRYKTLIYSPCIFLLVTVINLIITVFFLNLVTFILVIIFLFLTFGTVLTATILINRRNKINRTYHTILMNSGYSFFCNKCLNGVILRGAYKDMVSKEREKKSLGLFFKNDSFLEFNPLTATMDIPETSYSYQLGLYEKNWALRLYEGNIIKDIYIFTDEDITKWGFPDQNLLVGWILRKIPNLNPQHVMKVVRDLVRQAMKTTKVIERRREEEREEEERNKLRKEMVGRHLESIKNAVEKIEHLMKENAVNELAVEKIYLPEFFNADLLKLSQDGLPTLRIFVKKEFELFGIKIILYGTIVKFFRKK